jgi:peptidoglycan/xylan/chitin deacetylase (PgdA/CDA1 family)
MLKKLKQTTLLSLKTTGAFRLVHSSKWRRERLLILAYHGISLADEHHWNSGLYMSKDTFGARLSLIRKSGCNVLPLEEALSRLYSGDLPEKSVAITFDDGTYDFYRQAYPLLREFGYPATIYLTTFYAHFNRPVFDVACSYLLWKGSKKTLHLKALCALDERLDLSADQARAEALTRLTRFANEQKYSARAKDELLKSLAQSLDVDYDAFLASRILQLIKPEEVRELAAAGVDMQLHTHRHRTPRDRDLFVREIEDNRKSIKQVTGKSASHFCYPSGMWDASFLPWLREAEIRSATTCELGLASPESDRLLLPRLVDVCGLSPIEFESWLTGVSVAVPRRR